MVSGGLLHMRKAARLPLQAALAALPCQVFVWPAWLGSSGLPAPSKLGADSMHLAVCHGLPVAGVSMW